MRHTHKLRTILASFLFCMGALWTARADTILLAGDQSIDGTPIQTNGDQVLILTGYSAFNLAKSSIKTINAVAAERVELVGAGRLPNFKKAILFLGKQPWAANLTPIPATVIDKGILRNVPYVSFHCGDDYEINVYGDLDHPSGIEIGVYRGLLNDSFAKNEPGLDIICHE